MESLLFLGFRVLRVDTKNSYPKFTGKYRRFRYTFLFGAYLLTFRYKNLTLVQRQLKLQEKIDILSVE